MPRIVRNPLPRRLPLSRRLFIPVPSTCSRTTCQPNNLNTGGDGAAYGGAAARGSSSQWCGKRRPARFWRRRSVLRQGRQSPASAGPIEQLMSSCVARGVRRQSIGRHRFCARRRYTVLRSLRSASFRDRAGNGDLDANSIPRQSRPLSTNRFVVDVSRKAPPYTSTCVWAAEPPGSWSALSIKTREAPGGKFFGALGCTTESRSATTLSLSFLTPTRS